MISRREPIYNSNEIGALSIEIVRLVIFDVTCIDLRFVE